jgi:hypothetical protein
MNAFPRSSAASSGYAGAARVKFPTAGYVEFNADLRGLAAVVGFATVPPAPVLRIDPKIDGANEEQADAGRRSRKQTIAALVRQFHPRP